MKIYKLKSVIFIILFLYAYICNATCPTRTPNTLGENIIDWGATANDMTDDSSAIQCALDSASLNSKRLIIPSGTFTINQTITMNNNYYNFVQVVGVGWSSIINHTGGNYAFTVGDGVGWEPSSVTFRDFYIQSNNSSAYGGIFYMGAIDGSSNGSHRSLVDHMLIKGYTSETAGEAGEGAAAIKYRNTWVHTIRNTHIYDAFNGIYANALGSGEVNALNIESSDIEAVKYGVSLGQNTSVNIRNNTIEGPNVIAGIYCQAACKSINVVGNYFEFSGTEFSVMVYIGNSAWNSGINIKENYSNSTTTNSYIEIRNARGIDISGNTFIAVPTGTDAAFIKLGTGNAAKYFGVNNNYAGASNGEENWSGIRYIRFVDPATGVSSGSYARLGTLFDNLNQAFFYGTQTLFKRIDQ